MTTRRRAQRAVHPRTAAAAVLVLGAGLLAVPGSAAAQGNLSTQGFGYPPGQLSTASLAVGGALAELDPLSAINPAALAGERRAAIHLQYAPELRTVSTPQGTEHTTTTRFPVISASLPLGARLALGLSFSTLLDRTWESAQTGPVAVGDTVLPSTETFKSTGGIEDIQVDAGWSATSWLHAGLGLHLFTGQNQITAARAFPDTTVIKPVPFSETATYNYFGTGISGGVTIRASPLFMLAGSARLGGQLRVRRGDTLQSKGTVPPRVGAAVQFSGVPGVSLAARADWEGWSHMSGLGSPALQPRDAWGYGIGADIVGPRVGTDRNLALRVGGQTRTLPFLADGAVVRENDISGGFGFPFSFDRASLDFTAVRAFRSASQPPGVSEGAWILSVGFTVRP